MNPRGQPPSTVVFGTVAARFTGEFGGRVPGGDCAARDAAASRVRIVNLMLNRFMAFSLALSPAVCECKPRTQVTNAVRLQSRLIAAAWRTRVTRCSECRQALAICTLPCDECSRTMPSFFMRNRSVLG